MDENIIIASAGSELNNAVQVIKDAILQSQQRALKAINQEQLALYYGVGRYISANTRTKNWGTGFIDAISEQLRKEMPGLKGFSARNLKYMRMFYEQWKQLESPNSADGSAELQNADSIQALQITQLPDFPLVAFLSVGFSHHTNKTSADMDDKLKKLLPSVEDLEKLI